MRTPSGRTAFSLGIVLFLSACTSQYESHGCEGPAGDHVKLVDRLRCAGIRVDIGERVTVPILRPPGTKLLLSGDGLAAQAELSSFDYDDTDLGADGRAVSETDARKSRRMDHSSGGANPSITGARRTSSAASV